MDNLDITSPCNPYEAITYGRFFYTFEKNVNFRITNKKIQGFFNTGCKKIHLSDGLINDII